MVRYEQNLVRTASRDTGCHPSQLAPEMIATQPPIYTVVGCAQPVEYWLRCGRRNRNCRWRRVPTLNDVSAAALGCPANAIQQSPSQMPNVRYATGCGHSATFGLSCNGVSCGWVQNGPTQAAAGQAYAGAQTVVVPGPTAQAAVDPNALPAQIQAQREAILSCIDAAGVTLSVRWTAEGQVLLQLPEGLAGTEAEGCIQAAVGQLRVSANQAGGLEIPVN